jgi:hypothetical protein
LLLGSAKEHDGPGADRMMGVDEEGRAAAVGTEDFQEAAF